MIALLLLQCILEILVSKIQSGGMVILLICWVTSLQNLSFNLDPYRQAVEVHFSRNTNLVDTPPFYFNNLAVASCETHKHLGLLLYKRLADHVEEMILRASKGIGLITRLRRYLPRNSLTVYRAFIDLTWITKASYMTIQEMHLLCENVKTVQYNASLAVTGCFRGTSGDKLYTEFSLESLANRRFYRRLIAFYKIVVNKKAPRYLIDYLPTKDLASINLRKRPAIYPLDARTERYRNSFFPYCISQWNILDSRIRNLPSIATFKRAILDFIRPVPTPMFKINRLSGFVFLTRLRVGFSHLREHKFRHGFLDIVDPICSCRTNAVENTEHYLLHCSNFANQRTVLFDDLRNIDINYGPLDSSTLSRMLLFGNPKFFDNNNGGIIYVVIRFIE